MYDASQSAPHQSRTSAAVLWGVLALIVAIAAIATLFTIGDLPEAEASQDQSYRIARLVKQCPSAKPALAKAMEDDRLTESEANLVSRRIRELHDRSMDEWIRNQTREAAGRRPKPATVDCSVRAFEL